jgi:CRISPR-associated protein Cas2
MEHLYFISYDIGCPRRWRQVYKLMCGYGEWVQLSVFQCRLDRISILRLEASLAEEINAEEDHVLIIDLGPAAQITPRVKSLGKAGFEAIERRATIV